MVDTTGEQDLRAEYVDTAIKAIAMKTYVLKNLCVQESSSAWTETYFRETNTVITGGGVASPTTIKGVPRLAPFPYGQASWTKVSGVNDKYALEGVISYEDILMANISVIQRTLIKIAEGVVNAVDAQVAAVMAASFGNTLAISAGNEWDSATIANRDPVKDILDAVQTLRADNINALDGSGRICLNGTDYTNFISNSKVCNHPTFKSGVMENGRVAEILGMDIVVTESLEATTPDVAYIVMDKLAMTWKSVVPLTVIQIDDPGIKKTVRAYEIGQAQMVVPNAVCKITNTRK